jgi:hypothetical protein
MKQGPNLKEKFSEAERAYYQAAIDEGMASGFAETEIAYILPNIKKRVALLHPSAHNPGEGRDNA